MKQGYWLFVLIVLLFVVFVIIMGFNSSASAQSVFVSWQRNPIEEDVYYYILYLDGEYVPGEYDTCHTVTGFTFNEYHTFYIRAVNKDGVSDPSDHVTFLWMSWDENGGYNDITCFVNRADSLTLMFDLPPGDLETTEITISADSVVMWSIYDINKDGKISLSDLAAVIGIYGEIPPGFLELYGLKCVWRAE